MKHLFSKNTLKIRRHYDTFHNNFQRRASFIGSTNKPEFLSDKTGSRRFLCFSPKAIDYEHQVDLNKVFAQAIYLLNNNFKYWFDTNELWEIHDNNKNYEFQSQELKDVLNSYSPSSKSDQGVFLSTTEIAEELYKKTDQSILRQLGLAMKINGFKQRKKGHKHGYYVKRINND